MFADNVLALLPHMAPNATNYDNDCGSGAVTEEIIATGIDPTMLAMVPPTAGLWKPPICLLSL